MDDIADGDIPTNDPMQALEAWRGHLRGLAQNLPAEPGEPIILTALRGVVVDFGVAVQDLIAIVDGMAMDAAGPILAPDRETLELYCDRVASAVGRASGVILARETARLRFKSRIIWAAPYKNQHPARSGRGRRARAVIYAPRPAGCPPSDMRNA